MKRVEISHFDEYGIRPFCDQLSLHFRDFFTDTIQENGRAGFRATA